MTIPDTRVCWGVPLVLDLTERQTVPLIRRPRPAEEFHFHRPTLAVCTMRASLSRWVELTNQLLASADEHDIQKLLHDNAVRTYNVKV